MSARRRCVGALIRNAKGEVFVMRRAATAALFPGAWDIVGGHLEAGESMTAALAREIREETGWTLRAVGDRIGNWEGEHAGVVRHERDYLVEVDGNLTAPQLHAAEHDAWAWIGADALDLLLDGRADGDARLRDLVARALAVRRL